MGVELYPHNLWCLVNDYFLIPQKHIVSWEQIRRMKGVFTREKCKLFLKQCVHLSPSGYWVIKVRFLK